MAKKVEKFPVFRDFVVEDGLISSLFPCFFPKCGQNIHGWNSYKTVKIYEDVKKSRTNSYKKQIGHFQISGVTFFWKNVQKSSKMDDLDPIFLHVNQKMIHLDHPVSGYCDMTLYGSV